MHIIPELGSALISYDFKIKINVAIYYSLYIGYWLIKYFWIVSLPTFKIVIFSTESFWRITVWQ